MATTLLLERLEQKNEELNERIRANNAHNTEEQNSEIMRVMRELSALTRERRELFATASLPALLHEYMQMASDRYSHLPAVMLESIVGLRLNVISENMHDETDLDVAALQGLVQDANDYVVFMNTNEHNGSLEALRRRCLPQRVERWRDMIEAVVEQKMQERSNAFMMSTHGRLGNETALQGLDPGIMRMINGFAYK
jgi:hypothetical protein